MAEVKHWTVNLGQGLGLFYQLRGDFHIGANSAASNLPGLLLLFPGGLSRLTS